MSSNDPYTHQNWEMNTRYAEFSPYRTCTDCMKGFQPEDMKDESCPYCRGYRHAAIIWENPIELMKYWQERYEKAQHKIQNLNRNV